MSQHSLNTDVNAALAALGSCMKGPSAPPAPLAGMLWVDDHTSPWEMKLFDGADWILLGTIDPASNTFAAQLGDGSVTTVKLADGAVTLAKLENGNQGDILIYGAGGIPQRLPAGSSGQYLKTQGSSANPIWAPLDLPNEGKVKVSAADTTYGYLNGKLVAGDNITFTINNPGASETLTISGKGNYDYTTDTTITVGAGGMYATLAAALLALQDKRIKPGVTVTLLMASGATAESAPLVWIHPDSASILVRGQPPVTTTASAQVNVSGSEGAYSVSLTVSSSNGMAVGDYVIIDHAVGGSYPEVHEGCHVISSIDSASQITVINGARTPAWQGNGLTAANIACLKSRLTFTTEMFRPAMGNFLRLQDLALVGDGNDIGIYSNLPGASAVLERIGISDVSHGVYSSFGSVKGSTIAVSKFTTFGIMLVGAADGQCTNIIATGGSLNSGAGLYAGAGGRMFCSEATVAANEGYGIWVEDNSTVEVASHTHAVWNENSGLTALRNSSITAGDARVLKNGNTSGIGGIEARFNSYIGAKHATLTDQRGPYAVYCTPFSRVDIFASAISGGGDAVYAASGSYIYAVTVTGGSYSPAVNTVGNKQSFIDA